MKKEPHHDIDNRRELLQGIFEDMEEINYSLKKIKKKLGIDLSESK